MSQQFLRPSLLRPGDRIRIVAPSGPVDAEHFEQGIECLAAHELEAVYDKGVFAREGYLAGSDQRRQQEFIAALNDHSAQAIWFARGGYGAARILPLIDKVQLRANGPWLIGFSDASVMHARWQQSGLQSLHTANISGLSRWSERARQSLFQWLMHGTMEPLFGQTVLGRRTAEGPLVGGNITVLAALAGTGYLPSYRGAIVFLEDVGERPYRLDRSLIQLCQCGVFDGVAGFAIGQLTHCDDDDPRNGKSHGRSALEAVISVLEPLGAPILTGLPVGHERSSFSIPLGANAILDSATKSLRPS